MYNWIDSLKEEFITLVLKWWVVGSYITLAIVTKFSFDRMQGKKITFWEAVWGTTLAFTGGVWAAIICQNRGLEDQMFWIVPLTTIMADKIFPYLISNWKILLVKILIGSGFIKKKDMEDDA